MKTDKLLKTLATIAPGISIETIWGHDDDAKWDCDAPDINPDDFQAWQSEVRAAAIVGGKLIYGSAYLGGTWEKFGDNPSESNPEISGYFMQMAEEAITELKERVKRENFRPLDALIIECELAAQYLQRAMRESYDEQMKEIA